MIKFSFATLAIPTAGALVLTVAAGQKLGTFGLRIENKIGGALKRAMANSHFTGAKEQVLTVTAPAKSRISRIVLVGIGEPKDLTAHGAESAGGAAMGVLMAAKVDSEANFIFDAHKGAALDAVQGSAHMAYGAALRGYRFDKYLTRQKPEQKPAIKDVTLLTDDPAAARKLFATLERIAGGVNLARDLVSEPANILYPETMADACVALKDLGIKVEVLDEKQMAKLGMGALLGVAQGSVKPPRLVSMVWQGDATAKDKSPVALIGKGVTFDTGGISIKPASGMEEMKFDMAGAAAVIGTMKALAARKAKVNVVGLVGLVENMPSGNAQRPGDVLTTMSGQTVEVINTDAEGRLVLADVVWYAQEKFKPRCMVDLATLTGAIIIALGHEYAGLFCNDEKLADQLLVASKAVDEPLWRMPLNDAINKDLDTAVADMRNVTNKREAGSTVGAEFIKRFVKNGTPWAHLDIAGTAWAYKDKALCPKGASGYGVRLLERFVAENFEA